MNSEYKSLKISEGHRFNNFVGENDYEVQNTFIKFTTKDDEEIWKFLERKINEEYYVFDDNTSNILINNCFIMLKNDISYRYEVLSIALYSLQFVNSPLQAFEELRIDEYFISQLNNNIDLKTLQIILDLIERFNDKIDDNVRINRFNDIFDILIKFSISNDPIFSQLKSSFLDVSSKLLKRFDFNENYGKQLFIFFSNNLKSYNYNFDIIYIFRILESLLIRHLSLYDLFIDSNFFIFTFQQFSSQNDPLISCSLKIFLPILKNVKVINYFIDNNFIDLIKIKFGFFNYKVKIYIIKCINVLIENSPVILQQIIDSNFLKCADLFTNNFKLQLQTMKLIYKILEQNYFPNDEYIYHYTINNSISFLSSDEPDMILLSLKILIILHEKFHPIGNDKKELLNELINNLSSEDKEIFKFKSYLYELIN